MSVLPTTLYIPCYNSARFLDRVLPAAKAQTYPLERLFVLDDGSSDDTAAIARRHSVEVLSHGENRGLGAARNTAVRAAETPYVASLDSDVVAPRDWLERLTAQMAGGRFVGAGGNLVETVLETPADAWRHAHMQQTWGDQRLENPKFLCGNNNLFLKSALEKAGLYDDTKRTNGEDATLCARMRELGMEIVYDPAAECRHLREDDLDSICRSYWLYQFHGHEPGNRKQRRRRRRFARKMLLRRFFPSDLLAGRFSVAWIDLVMYARWTRREWSGSGAL